MQRGIVRTLDADRGYVGLITKTPGHPAWYTSYQYPYLHSLADLAAELPAEAMRADPRPAHTFGLGRNGPICSAEMRQVAYRGDAVLKFKREGRSLEQFVSYIATEAAQHNLQFATPLGPSELRSTARSVARWTWHEFSRAILSHPK